MEYPYRTSNESATIAIDLMTMLIRTILG